MVVNSLYLVLFWILSTSFSNPVCWTWDLLAIVLHGAIAILVEIKLMLT